MMKRRTFLRQIGCGTAGLATMIYLPGCSSGAQHAAAGIYSPESQGVSSQGLIDFFEAAGKSGLEFHSIMINRNGNLLLEGWWEPFRKEYLHTLYSLSKSFTSTAVGMLSDEGKLAVTDKVISFFPDKLPSKVSENLAAMTVHDLLTMHSGHDSDTMGELRRGGDEDWVRTFLHLDVPKAPGSHFFYNTGASYMLSAIVQQISGENLMQFLKPRLFDPLGVTGADWEEDPRGINVGGYGLRIRTQDILNFGQLYLQEGEWNGKQLLSRRWIGEATKKQVNSQDNDSDWGQGYGYQFWRCKPGCYRGDGAFGQYCIVVPEKNAVIAITSETRDMGASMQLVWDHILPAMHDEPIKESQATLENLRKYSQELSLPVTRESATTGRQEALSGTTFAFDPNEAGAQSVTFAFENDVCNVTIVENAQPIAFKCGQGKWVTDGEKPGDSLFALPGRTPMPTKISGNYYWKDSDTLVMTLKYVENAHHDILTFAFTDQGLTLSFNNSVAQQREEADPRAPLQART